MAKPKPPATASEPIDWPRLLIGRPSPPPGWWVSLAIERQVGTVELRASAVVAILAPPLCLSPGRAPYLAQLPRLAKEWISLLKQHDTFICLGPDSDAMRSAVTILLSSKACCDAMRETRTSGPDDCLVPELWAMYREAAELVEALEAAGIPLSARHNRMSAEERAELKTAVIDLGPVVPLDPTLPAARVEARATPKRRKAEPKPTPRQRRIKQEPPKVAVADVELTPDTWLL